jgi:hypothetical protein
MMGCQRSPNARRPVLIATVAGVLSVATIIVLAGCPKKHLEGDTHALEEQSRYWRNNLPRLIASRFGLQPPDGFAYAERDQFR